MNIRAQSTFRAGDFARLEALILPRVQAAVTTAADAVLEQAQSNAPVQSGELRDSGRREVVWEGQRVDGYVVFDAAHAAFIEFGTGLRGAGTYPYALPQSGTPFTGSWVYDYKNQGWVGMRAHPYIRPALDSRRDDIRAAFVAQGFQV